MFKCLKQLELLFLVIICAIGLNFAVFPALVKAQTLDTLFAVDDAYIRSNSPNTNYGTEQLIEIKEYSIGTTRRGLLKFDLSQISDNLLEDTVSVILRLNLKYHETNNWGDKDYILSLYASDISDWDSNHVTFQSFATPPIKEADDKSQAKTEVGEDFIHLGDIKFNFIGNKMKTDEWFELDITDYIKSKPDQNIFTIVMLGQINSQTLLRFGTKEGGSSAQLTFKNRFNLLEDGLLLHADFDHVADGQIKDVSERNNHGNLVGSPGFVKGVRGNAISINNTNKSSADQYVNFGKAADLQFGTSDFSVSFWMQAENYGRHDTMLLGNKNYDNGSNIGFGIGNFNASGQLDIRANFSGKQGTRAEVKDIPANHAGWHHVAVSMDRNGYMMTYLDGEFFGSVSLSGHADSCNTGLDFVLGADGNKKYAVSSTLIDELRIYDRAIDAETVKQLYILEGNRHIYEKLAADIDKLINSLDNLDDRIFDSNYIHQLKVQLEESKNRIRSAESYDKALEIREQAIEDYDRFLIGREPIMSFFAISDIHIRSSQPQVASQLIKGLKDMKRIASNADGFMSAGDYTQDGNEKEYIDFYSIIEKYTPVSAENTMIILGNHDVRGVQGGGNVWSNDPNDTPQYFSKAREYYLSLNAPYMRDNTVLYHDKWIGGYHFIMLNTEKGLKDSSWFSKEQIAWFQEKLAENAVDNKPIFVSVHQALNDTHWRSNSYSGFGYQDEEIKEILTKYPQVILLNGHIHNGLGVIEVIDREYGTMVEIPSFSLSENGVKDNGTGYYVAVYDDLVVFRARNFITSKWLPEYDLYVEMPSLPIIFKEANALNSEEYTTETWANVEKAMRAAQAIMNKEYPHPPSSFSGPPTMFLYHQSTRDEINQIKMSLRNAIDMLIRKQK